MVSDKGKVQIVSEKGVLLSSEGSAAFLTQLMKKDIDVLSTWQSAGIKYLNIIDLNNLNAKILDPFSIGLMVERGYDCVSDVYQRDTDSVEFNHPCVLENKFHFMDLYQPFELYRACEFQGENQEIFKYESLHLNMFTRLDFIVEMIKVHTGRLFEYRIKQKATKGYSSVFSSFIPWVCPQFSFELSAYNLMRLTDKTFLVKRDRSSVLDIEELLLKGQ